MQIDPVFRSPEDHRRGEHHQLADNSREAKPCCETYGSGDGIELARPVNGTLVPSRRAPNDP